MTHDETIHKAKQVLEDAGYTVTGRRIHDLDLLLVMGASAHSHSYPVNNMGEVFLRGSAFDLVIHDDLQFTQVDAEIMPPKNKPWYQKHDKYVGKQRK